MAAAYDIEAASPLRTLGPHGSSQPQTQRSGNTTANQQEPRHDGLYSKILKDRQANGHEFALNDEFYGSDEIEKVTVQGFPSIAAFHTNYANTRICRAFANVTQTLMTRYQYQITCLLGALVELDAESVTERDGQSAPFDKERFISRCSRSPDQLSLVTISTKADGSEEDEEQKKERIEVARENVVANLERSFSSYRSLVNWQGGLPKFPKVSTRTHKRLFEYIKRMDGLGPDAIDYLRAYDDLIYADADPLYERFYTFLIYVREAFIIIVRYLSCKRIFANGDVSFGTGAYEARKIRLFVKSQMVLAGSALVLIPVGILYLKEPRKEIAFLLVALFGLVFAFTLIAFDNQMSHVLLGLAAYYAVLVGVFNIYS